MGFPFGGRKRDVCSDCGAPSKHLEWDVGFGYPDRIFDGESGLILTGRASGFVRCLLEVDVVPAGDQPVAKSEARQGGSDVLVFGHLRVGLWLALDQSTSEALATAWNSPDQYGDLRFTGTLANRIGIWPQISDREVSASVRSPDQLPWVDGGDPDVVHVIEHVWPMHHVTPLIVGAK